LLRQAIFDQTWAFKELRKLAYPSGLLQQTAIHQSLHQPVVSRKDVDAPQAELLSNIVEAISGLVDRYLQAGQRNAELPRPKFYLVRVSRVTLISSNNFGRMPPNAVLGLMFLPSRLAMTLGQFASVERLDGGRIMRMKAGLLAPPTSRSRLAEQSATYRAGVRSRRR
jgi:hypothetical protein